MLTNDFISFPHQVARQRLGARYLCHRIVKSLVYAILYRAVLNFPSEVNTPNDADISDAMEYKVSFQG
jgi:hypothetical protein